MPGLWYLNPSEIGPYGPSGAPAVTASASFSVVTKAFDATVKTTTGDLWTVYPGLGSGFTPLYLAPGASATITVTITPKASSGTHVAGAINLSDTFLANVLIGLPNTSGDELASLPFTYTVK